MVKHFLSIFIVVRLETTNQLNFQMDDSFSGKSLVDEAALDEITKVSQKKLVV